MPQTRALLQAFVGAVAPALAGGACLQPYVSVDTTAFSFSGCFKETIYAGTYETVVWTMDGLDVVDTGTQAISASLLNGPDVDPVWTFGSVRSLPQNSWSDGYSAGLELVNLKCTGTSAFWETKHPTDETQWECDANGDGVRSVAESGDFAVTCGCPNQATPAPVSGAQVPTAAPVPATAVQPTIAPSSAVVGALTTAPIPAERAVPLATPAPVVGGALAPAAPACNITISSPDLQQLNGCYVGQASSNSRGKWVKLDETATVEWQETGGTGADGSWVVVLVGPGGLDETRCTSSQDVQDPTEISSANWMCDLDGGGVFTVGPNFGFEGLACSGTCDVATSIEAIEGDNSSDDGTGRTMAIVVGSVVSGVGLAALLVVGVVLMKKRSARRATGTGTKSAESGESTDSADPNAPAPVPVFEPWGTRPPPRYYG